MREIEFRGKVIDKDVKGWIYGTLLRIPSPPVCIGEKKPDTYYIVFADPSYTPDWNMPYRMVQGEVIPETIGQYIGLKDKNGQKIYEGDIVKDNYCIYKVVYDGNGYYVEVVKVLKECGTDKGLLYDISDYTDLEVIGNIIDNLELLS